MTKGGPSGPPSFFVSGLGRVDKLVPRRVGDGFRLLSVGLCLLDGLLVPADQLRLKPSAGHGLSLSCLFVCVVLLSHSMLLDPKGEGSIGSPRYYYPPHT